MGFLSRFKKKAYEWDLITALIIGVLVLALIVIVFFYVRRHGSSALAAVKSIFRLGAG